MSADTNRKQASAGIIPRIGSRINGDVALALLTGVLATLVLAFVFSPEIHQYGDNCGYMMAGISLSQGYGPRMAWWPAGFPMLIALFHRLVGPQWGLLKVLILLTLFTALYLFVLQLKRKGLSVASTAGLLAAICLSSCLHMVSSYLYPETFFLAATLLFFVLWEHWQHRLSFFRVVGLSLAATAIASVRNVGLVLPMSLAIMLLARGTRDWRQRLWPVLPIAVALLYVAAASSLDLLRAESLMGYFRRLGSGTNPSDVSQTSTGGLIWRNAAGALHAARSLTLTLIPQSLVQTVYYVHPMNKIKAAAMLCVTGVVAWGWWRTWKQQALVNLSVALYVTALLGHGIHYTRLMVPIVPFLFVYLYFGITALVSLAVTKRRVATAILTALWLAVIVDNALWSFTDPRKLMPPRAGNEAYQRCLDWVLDHARPGQTVMSDVYLYTVVKRGHRDTPFPDASTPDGVIVYMDQRSVDYIVVPSWKGTGFGVFSQTRSLYPERFQVLYGDQRGACVLGYRDGT